MDKNFHQWWNIHSLAELYTVNKTADVKEVIKEAESPQNSSIIKSMLSGQIKPYYLVKIESLILQTPVNVQSRYSRLSQVNLWANWSGWRIFPTKNPQTGHESFANWKNQAVLMVAGSVVCSLSLERRGESATIKSLNQERKVESLGISRFD